MTAEERVQAAVEEGWRKYVEIHGREPNDPAQRVIVAVADPQRARRERLASWRGLVRTQHKNGWLPDAGGCWVRVLPGQPQVAQYHPLAITGASQCEVCGRVVLRGEGRWWE